MTSVQHNDNKSIEEILAEAYRVLKPGGKYFGMMIKDDYKLSDKSFFTNYLTDTDIKKYFNIFRDIEINSTRYTEENGSKFIEFHIITGSA